PRSTRPPGPCVRAPAPPAPRSSRTGCGTASASLEPNVETVALSALRRYVVAHQQFATRPRTSTPDDVAATVRRLGCVQLDSISTVDRAHRLTLTSRLG